MKYLLIFLFFICCSNIKADTWNNVIIPDTKIQLTFTNKSLHLVAQNYSKHLQIPIIVSPDFNKNIYLYTPNKVSLKDALTMLEACLQFYGYKIEYKNNLFVIDKAKENFQENKILLNETSKKEDMEIKVFQLKNNNSENISRIINELFFPTPNLDFIWNFLSNSPQFFNVTR